MKSWPRMSGSERRALIEAALLLPAAAVLIRVASFPRVIHFGLVGIGRPSHSADRIVTWAVPAAARRMPFRALCFEQGLVAQRMLRRRGVEACLHYGITNSDRLEAHVWISIDGRIVLGGEEASRFAEVGRWP